MPTSPVIVGLGRKPPSVASNFVMNEDTPPMVGCLSYLGFRLTIILITRNVNEKQNNDY